MRLDSLTFKLAQKLSIFLACSMFLFHSSPAISIDISDNIELHGYASLGYINSNNNPFYGKDTLKGSLDFHEAAINGFWEVNDKLRFSGQLLYRKTGDYKSKTTNLDLLFADYRLIEDSNHSIGIRLGRVKLPYGLYNTSRDVPHGRPGMFVPMSIYFESLRDALIAIDGASLYGDIYGDFGTLDYAFFAGKSKIHTQSMEYFIFNRDIQGTFKDTDIKGLQVLYRPAQFDFLKLGYSLLNVNVSLDDGSKSTFTSLNQQFSQEYLSQNAINPLLPTASELRLAQGYAMLKIQDELSSNLQAHVRDASLDGFLHLFSLQAHWQSLTFTAEYMQTLSKVSSNIANLIRQKDENHTEAYYLQVEWQALDNLLLLARYQATYLDMDDRDGKDGFANGFVLNPHSEYSTGVTLGARYYFDTDWSITAEYAKNRGVLWVPKDEKTDIRALKKEWDFFALQLSYHF